jgi:hypothetical protein
VRHNDYIDVEWDGIIFSYKVTPTKNGYAVSVYIDAGRLFNFFDFDPITPWVVLIQLHDNGYIMLGDILMVDEPSAYDFSREYMNEPT